MRTGFSPRFGLFQSGENVADDIIVYLVFPCPAFNQLAFAPVVCVFLVVVTGLNIDRPPCSVLLCAVVLQQEADKLFAVKDKHCRACQVNLNGDRGFRFAYRGIANVRGIDDPITTLDILAFGLIADDRAVLFGVVVATIETKISRAARTNAISVTPSKRVFDCHFKCLADDTAIGLVKCVLLHSMYFLSLVVSK